MPSLRALLLVSVGLVVLLLAALLAVPGFIDWRAAKPRLEAELSAALGREVAVDGDLSLYFLPRPWLMAEGLRIANRSEGSEPELLRVAGLEMRVALWPLLSGHFEVESLRLLRPVLLLEHLADGSGNWTGMATEALLGSPAQADSVSLTSLEMRDGELVWRDHVAGREERLSSLDAQLSAGSLRGPLVGEGRFRYQGQPFTFDLMLGAPDRRERQSLRLQLALPEAVDAELRLSGHFSRGEDAQEFGGQATLMAPEASALLRAFTGAEPSGLDLTGELTAQSSVAWAHGEVALERLEVDFADTRFEGGARLRPAAAAAFDLELSARFLNLDPLLEPERLAWPRLALPPQLGGVFTLRIERVLWRDQSLKAAELAGSVENGGLLVDRAAAVLPGGGSVMASGRMALTPQSPGFRGHITAESPNLRAQLAWLGHEVEFAAPDRVRRLSLAAALEAEPGLVRLADLDLSLDRMRLRGGVALALRERPGLGLSLSADQADLDAYLDPLEFLPGELLGMFDANLELAAGSLRFAGRRAEGVRLVASLREGLLQVKDLQIEDLGGAHVVASGKVDRLEQAWPRLRDGRISLNVGEMRHFLQALKLQAPPLVRQLDALQAEGELEADGQEADLRLKLAALDGRGKLLLSVVKEDEGLRVRAGRLDLQRFSLAALESFVVNDGLARETGNLTVSFTGDRKRLAHKSRLEVEQAVVDLEGTLEAPWSRTPQLHGALRLQHPDAQQLARFLLPQAAQWLSGEVELEARLAAEPERLLVDDLEGRAGDLVFSGSLLRRGGFEEALDLDLSLGEVSVAALLGVVREVSPIARWRDPRGRWSRTPLHWHALQGPNLDLRLAIARLDLGHAALEDLELALTRQSQAWHLDRFEAAAESGRIRARAAATADPLEGLALEAQVTAEALPISLLRPWFPSMSIASGSLGTSIAARTTGTSPAELVAGLAGEGKLEGSLLLEVADPPGGGLNGAVLPSLLAEMDSGQLWFSGEAAAAEGRVTVSALQLVGHARRLVVSGALADLPLRRANLDILLYDQEAAVPVKEMILTGPLDQLEFRIRRSADPSTGPADKEVTPAPAASDAAALPHEP